MTKVIFICGCATYEEEIELNILNIMFKANVIKRRNDFLKVNNRVVDIFGNVTFYCDVIREENL